MDIKHSKSDIKHNERIKQVTEQI